MADQRKVLNFNVGVLGHVDSGKTSLAEALSTVASTAAFDKNPQSKERGITLDLGFSSFTAPSPDHLRSLGIDAVQYTLVDCPGHASLIKTIIGGAQIIDLMLLVVDATKGIQTQTAECLVLGEITCSKLIVVLNKIDLLEGKSVEKTSRRMSATLAGTKAFKDAPVVAASAKPGDPDVGSLVEAIRSVTFVPERRNDDGGSFVFSVDHCFGIRGQGTVMTGTMLRGRVAVGDPVEISALKEVRKVRSMQMFRKPVSEATQGDRVGICVTQFDASALERGLVATPGFLPTVFGCVVSVRRISYYKGEVRTKAKFHVSIGHETVLATVTLLAGGKEEGPFSFDDEFKVVPLLLGDDPSEGEERARFALLDLERPLVVVPGCKVLGSKLDVDIHKNVCRLAFEGRLVHVFKEKAYRESELRALKIFKLKRKQGVVERMANEHEVICKNMFKKETNIALFSGLKVTLSSGESGTIEGSFGQSGKFKVRMSDALSEEAQAALSKKKGGGGGSGPVQVVLNFKKYVYSDKLVQ